MNNNSCKCVSHSVLKYIFFSYYLVCLNSTDHTYKVLKNPLKYIFVYWLKFLEGNFQLCCTFPNWTKFEHAMCYNDKSIIHTHGCTKLFQFLIEIAEIVFSNVLYVLQIVDLDILFHFKKRCRSVTSFWIC